MADKQSPLINLVFDPHSVVALDADKHRVSNAAEYSAARVLIERLKVGDSSVSTPLNIVVRKHSLLYGFEDIRAWPAHLVNYKDASPRPSIQRVLQEPLSEDITDERLLAWGICSISDLPADDPETYERNEEWLIDCALEKVTNCDVWLRTKIFHNENWMIDWFDFLLTGEIERLYEDDYLVQVVQRRVKKWARAYPDRAPGEFVELLLKHMSRETGRQAANQLAARLLLQKYGVGNVRFLVTNLSVDLVGVWIKWKLSARSKRVMEQLTDRLYIDGRLNMLVQEIDQLVRRELGELNPEDDLERYVDRMSGFFSSEYQSVVFRFCDSLVDDYGSEDFNPRTYYTSLGLIAEKFEILLAQEALLQKDYQDWMYDLLSLARSLHRLRSAEPTTMDEWWKVCTSMMRCEHLLCELLRDCLPELAEGVNHLKDEFVRLNKALNNEYGDWLLDKFPDYLENQSQARMVTQAVKLATDTTEFPESAILLVVDGLRWDWWKCLARHLAERGYKLESGDSVGLAMLPTVTNVSRRAALGHFPLLQLIDFWDDIYEVDVPPDEEALLAARVLGYADQLRDIEPTANKRIKYLSGQYIYVNGRTDDIAEALRLPARHYVVVYTNIDRAAHHESEEEVLQETVSTSLRILAETIADGITQNPHLDSKKTKLIVTADHGCAYTRWSEQKSLPTALKSYTEPDPYIERHGRVGRVIVTKDVDNIEAVRQQVKAFYRDNKADWHVIWGEKASDYGLPRQDRKGRQIIAWLSPRNMNYLRRGNGLYVHGGFSLYETIVPLATLRYIEERRLIVPTMLLTGLEGLRKEKTSTILVSIGNENDGELTGTISIPELRVREFKIEPVPAGTTVPTEVPVNPRKSGETAFSVVLHYRVRSSEEMECRKQYLANIAMSRREKMELETEREPLF
jgi:hypothetical protein